MKVVTIVAPASPAPLSQKESIESFFQKEGSEHREGFFLQNSALANGGGLQRVCGQFDKTFASSRAWILCRINDAADARVDCRACAHRARLKSDVEGAIGKPPTARHLPRLGDRQSLGVGSGIVELLAQIVRSAKDFAVSDKNCAYGNFSQFCRFCRLG